jgi:ABC-type Fe3+-hydroxamate transport system substrate-binding protein
MKEDRAQRFKRIATYRTNEVLEKLRLLGNLSNRANYDYTEDEIDKIFSAVDSQIRAVKAKFSSSKKRKDFSL